VLVCGLFEIGLKFKVDFGFIYNLFKVGLGFV